MRSEVIYNYRIKLYPTRDFTITAWSGSFATRIIYDIFHRVGLDFEKRRKKPFVVEPLIDSKGDYIITGVKKKVGDRVIDHPKYGSRKVKVGELLQLSVYLLGERVIRAFLEGLLKGEIIEEPATDLYIVSVEASQIDLEKVLKTEVPLNSHLIKLYVNFTSPTCFMFRGFDIHYPSPTRFLASALKNLNNITGIDTRHLIELISTTIELVSPKLFVKKVDGKYRLRRDYVSLLLDIGEGRKQPAFMGKAIFLLNPRIKGFEIILKAIKLAEIVGIGISRAIGMGRIKVERIEY